MPRKIILIPVILLSLIGIIFASGILFPDTAIFPRFPTNPGTIGGFLTTYFKSDGTANNTNMLSGVTASGYLQNNYCSTNPINNVWVGVDADGRAICGNTAGLLTAAPIGHFSELYGTVTVTRSGTTTPVAALVNQDLYEGDLIHSDPNGTGTIAFSADASLLRFFVSTDLELRYGLLGGNTVAEAILSDGSLWGRILTSTGVNIGGGGVVTGVRGTSVYLTKTSTGFELNLVNSTRTDNEVNRLMNTQTTFSNGMKGFGNTAITSMTNGAGQTVSSNTIGSGTTLSYGALATSVTTLVQNPAIYLSTNQWIRDNTIADIEYMSNLLSGATNPALIAKLNAELNTTVMSGNTLVAEALIAGGAISGLANIASGAVLLDEENQTDVDEPTQDEINKNKASRLNCKRLFGKTYFRSLGGCFGHWKDLAITDFGTNLNLHGKKARWNFTASGGSTNMLTLTGHYLEYSGSLSDLNGKTIRIEYTGTGSWAGKNMFFTKHSSMYTRIVYGSGWNFNSNIQNLLDDLHQGPLGSGYYYVSFKIKNSSNIDTFIIGNNNNYNNALIGATITKVSIQ